MHDHPGAIAEHEELTAQVQRQRRMYGRLTVDMHLNAYFPVGLLRVGTRDKRPGGPTQRIVFCAECMALASQARIGWPVTSCSLQRSPASMLHW